MKATITTAASFAIVLFAGYAATAQEFAAGSVVYAQPYLVQHHASTVMEGYLRGQGDWVEAWACTITSTPWP